MTEEMKKYKIAICTHVFNHVDFEIYFNHIFCISNWSRKYDLLYIGKSGLDAATARNSIVDTAIENGCSHLLFIDGDHFIPDTMLENLLESGNEAMTSGLVCKKGEGFPQVCWQVVKDANGKEGYHALNLPVDGRVYEVHVCAFGCTLINIAELQKLEKPYFRDTCVDGINIRSDINLCNAFRKIGAKMFVDTRVLIGHLGVPTVVYPHTAEMIKALKELERKTCCLREGQAGSYYKPFSCK